jgi:hypothetical protein
MLAPKQEETTLGIFPAGSADKQDQAVTKIILIIMIQH